MTRYPSLFCHCFQIVRVDHDPESRSPLLIEANHWYFVFLDCEFLDAVPQGYSRVLGAVLSLHKQDWVAGIRSCVT